MPKPKIKLRELNNIVKLLDLCTNERFASVGFPDLDRIQMINGIEEGTYVEITLVCDEKVYKAKTIFNALKKVFREYCIIIN